MSEAPHAVILAGGEGTRLRPLTNTLPKPMLPILGTPCIQFVIDSLIGGGVKNVHLACGYRSQDLINSLQDLPVSAAIDFALEKEPAGTAGAVKLLEDKLSQTFIVASGDVLADVDIQKLLEEHKRSGAVATMALTEVENPTEFGIVGLDDEGRIARFLEKPKPEEVFSNLINAGIYVLDKKALEYVPPATKFDFSKNLFPSLLADGYRLQGSVLQGLWKDIGRPEDLLDANLKMAERRGTEGNRSGAVCSGRIVAADFSGRGCSINGPSYLGDKVAMQNGSDVSMSAVGHNCSIGARSSLAHALILENCEIGSDCSLQNVILGRGCRISDGTVLKDAIIADGSKL